MLITQENSLLIFERGRCVDLTALIFSLSDDHVCADFREKDSN